jgi:prevent-host-death family protein
MNAVKIADLKNNLSRHLARVRRGGSLTVLDRNAPIARIVPIEHPQAFGQAQGPDRIAELIGRGVAAPGNPQTLARWVETHPPIKRPKRSASAVQTLLDMRRASSR